MKELVRITFLSVLCSLAAIILLAVAVSLWREILHPTTPPPAVLGGPTCLTPKGDGTYQFDVECARRKGL